MIMWRQVQAQARSFLPRAASSVQVGCATSFTLKGDPHGTHHRATPTRRNPISAKGIRGISRRTTAGGNNQRIATGIETEGT